MISAVFKNIGKGIGYFFLFPTLLIAIAIYAVFGLLVFVYQFFKLIFLFFTGRTLFSDLPEDIELRAKMTKDEPQEEQKEEEENKQLSLYPSDSVVYGSNYSSPLFSEKKEKPEKEGAHYGDYRRRAPVFPCSSACHGRSGPGGRTV